VSVRLRRARAGESERLREVLAAAKGHWGYDPALVTGWAASIDMRATLREQEVWVAEPEEAAPAVAWAGLVPPRDGVAVLDHLWVEPGSMRAGIGSALFRRAAERATELGAARMEWEAEPHALAFYRRMGGRDVRQVIGEWGRAVQVMGIHLGAQAESRSAR
jgi:GNAT superfamily N-acetyltransferase